MPADEVSAVFGENELLDCEVFRFEGKNGLTSLDIPDPHDSISMASCQPLAVGRVAQVVVGPRVYVDARDFVAGGEIPNDQREFAALAVGLVAVAGESLLIRRDIETDDSPLIEASHKRSLSVEHINPPVRTVAALSGAWPKNRSAPEFHLTLRNLEIPIRFEWDLR